MATTPRATVTETTLRLPCHDAERWGKIEDVLLRGAAVDRVADMDALVESLSGTKCSFFSQAESMSPNSFDWPSFVAAVPAIRRLAADMPALFPSPPPFVLRGSNSSVTLTRRQIACLIAHSVLGTVTGEDRPPLEFNSFSVRTLLNPRIPSPTPALCVLHYLRRSVVGAVPPGEVTFRRQLVPLTAAAWRDSQKPMCPVEFFERGSISDDPVAQFHADFANEYIGGGALSGGCAQEEILFCMKPELMASMALMDVMDKREAIVIEGAVQYSLTHGYGATVVWAGDAPMPSEQQKTPAVLAFDAIIAFSIDQFVKAVIQRDVTKAFAAFHTAGKDAIVATGNWGCGAFGGDPQLKFFQQWLAASEAGLSSLHYYTFGSGDVAAVARAYEELKALFPNVGVLYHSLMKAPFLAPGAVLEQILEFSRPVAVKTSDSIDQPLGSPGVPKK